MIREVAYSNGTLKIYVQGKKEPFVVTLQEEQTIRNAIEQLLVLVNRLVEVK